MKLSLGCRSPNRIKGDEKMIDLAIMLSKDESNEDKVKKQCSNCKWRSYEDITQQMICNNHWSENLNPIIDGSDTCERFELDRNIFWTNHKKYFGKPLKVGDRSCRNHGGRPLCEGNRTFRYRKKIERMKEEERIMRRKDILDKIFEKMAYYLGCYGEESNVAPVDRDRLMKALCNEIGFNYTWNPVWIRVKDRLPEDETLCLVTRKPVDCNLVKYGQVELDYWLVDECGIGRWLKFSSEWETTAWIPLPKPYNGGCE